MVMVLVVGVSMNHGKCMQLHYVLSTMLISDDQNIMYFLHHKSLSFLEHRLFL